MYSVRHDALLLASRRVWKNRSYDGRDRHPAGMNYLKMVHRVRAALAAPSKKRVRRERVGSIGALRPLRSLMTTPSMNSPPTKQKWPAISPRPSIHQSLSTIF